MDVIKSLENRNFPLKNNRGKHKRTTELFAEEELVRKYVYQEMRCEMPGLPRSTFLMVFSPDGTKVASTHGNHHIYITDIRTGKNIRTLIGHPRTPWCIAFHPTSNQIIASGCLGGQVRIWDLSGGSEVWTVSSQSVIASIAFHPNDRILVIATFNEVYFWDWSKPEPFVHSSTSNPKEKVRYVAFDKLGHKLITGIANSPQTRWERVRAPVPVPRQAERFVCTYRRSITPRLVNNQAPESSGPDRERRIAECYRNLVREYEQLVHRYLQLYRPTMIDRGTDPMEPTVTGTCTNSTQTPNDDISNPEPGPSTRDDAQPSTSAGSSSQSNQSLITPSKIFLKCKKGSKGTIKGTQTESRKRSGGSSSGDPRVKRSREGEGQSNVSQNEIGTQTQSPRRVLVINTTTMRTPTPEPQEPQPSTSGCRITCMRWLRNRGDMLNTIRRTAEEEVRNRILPIIRSVPANDRAELMRLFENNRERLRRGFRSSQPGPSRRRTRILDSSSDNGSSDEDEARNSNTERNFNTELENLVTSLLSEINPNSEESPASSETNLGSEVRSSLAESFDLLNSIVTRERELATQNANLLTRIARFNESNSGTARPWNLDWSERTSAFAPPVNSNANNNVQNRATSTSRNSSLFAADEVVNYAERANSEDDPPDRPDSSETGITNICSNIVQDLENSLDDVMNLRQNARVSETNEMLSSFSDRLAAIISQSDAILRNFSNAELSSEAGGSSQSPNWSFDNPGFFMRDRSERPNAAETDHTYPRSSTESSTSPDMPPLISALHMTVTHIQRQARMLREQCDSIERIDRGMIEVSQLQLMGQLIVELVRHVRSLGEERERSNTVISNVRQMMAGARISDSDSGNGNTNNPEQNAASPSNPEPGTSTNATSNAPSTSTNSSRPRGSGRKTYPPSRLFQVQRMRRRPSILHLFSRRLNRQRGAASSRSSNTNSSSRGSDLASSIRNLSFSTYSVISSASLQFMTRRIEQFLTEQMRQITRQDNTQNARSTAATELGEHIIALRLQSCFLRMNRVFGSSVNGGFRNLNADPSAAVTADGVARYAARHTLSLIIDGVSRHMEELRNNNMSQNLRVQIHALLASSLLLTELLLLQVVDSHPAASTSLSNNIRDHRALNLEMVYARMVHRGSVAHTDQLSRSLRWMRLTMRHVYRALERTYTTRRNAMLPRANTDLRQLIGSIHRCLRTLNRRRQATENTTNSSTQRSNDNEENSESGNAEGTNEETNNETDNSSREWANALSDFLSRYSTRNENAAAAGSSTPQREEVRNDNSSNNSDDEDGSGDWRGTFYNSGASNSNSSNSNNGAAAASPSAGRYRNSSANLNEYQSRPRPWNVPSVHVNDVPVSDPSLFHQRMTQGIRFAERLAGLRPHSMDLFRNRFLHPLYTSVNPLDADIDDLRDQIHDSDMITTVNPNHRIQAWDISNGNIPDISSAVKNVVVGECKIHNDASVDVAKDGSVLVTLLPSRGYLNITNRLGIYSLKWESLGQCLYTTSFEQNAVSVSLSPLNRHLVVGLASRRISIMPSERWVMAKIFRLEEPSNMYKEGLTTCREMDLTRDNRINCIRWLPASGQGMIFATNTGQLVILT